MRIEDAKTAIKSLAEVTEGQKESCRIVAEVGNQAEATKKLFREGNQSKLIKLGVALSLPRTHPNK